MMLELNAAELAFRNEVREFLNRELTEDLRQEGRRCSGIFAEYAPSNRWHRILAKRGWSVPHWPVEHGGTGWTPVQHYIFHSECADADAPPRSPVGSHMVAPVIIAFGTDEQKQHWLPGIRDGSDYWAQGYSEPQAGSDLAALQLRAVPSEDGKEYILNGTKIWTTHVHFANKMFCLVRTSNTGKLQQGITFICYDLPLPGVTIRPIISLAGDHELNQVFFDDVRVPVSGRIGEQDQGWKIAKYLLLHERGSAWAPGLRARLRRVRAAAVQAFAVAHCDSAERHAIERKLVEAECRIDAVEAVDLRSLRAQVRGEPPGIRPSLGKVMGSETRQQLTELAVEIAALNGLARVPLEACAEGELTMPEDSVFAMSSYLNDRAASIYAGTNEVQRNIIAAQLLAS